MNYNGIKVASFSTKTPKLTETFSYINEGNNSVLKICTHPLKFSFGEKGQNHKRRGGFIQ